MLPKPMEEALFAGAPPFDGIDAVFVSHYHGDHFSPEDVLRLLRLQAGIHLYAPLQAVKGLQAVAGAQGCVPMICLHDRVKPARFRL